MWTIGASIEKVIEVKGLATGVSASLPSQAGSGQGVVWRGEARRGEARRGHRSDLGPRWFKRSNVKSRLEVG
jgi:hypothetical protein